MPILYILKKKTNMNYFFNYFSVGFIIVVLLFSIANLNSKRKAARAELLPKKSKTPYKNNIYVKAHKAMINQIQDYNEYLEEAISEGKPQHHIDAHKEDKPDIGRNLRNYWG